MTANDYKNDERSIFLTALEQDSPQKREAYLAGACADNPALRRRVEALLSSHQGADALFGKLAPERVAEVLATVLPGGDSAAGPMNDHVVSSLAFLSPSDKRGSKGKLGTYDVEELVGSGGMGVVLKAFDERLHRSVAVKVMSPALASNEHARRRFIREGRAAAAVRDDHVIGIHGVDEANRLPFLVMEYIVGRSLAQRLEAEGPLPVTDILRIGGQIARGLAAAHAQGVVHRDIKPANILLENGVERVKITDFGLAHAVDDVRTTKPGTVVGTPEYMSPEQARGERVDHRSDLFSLGCVLYAMCAGRPPFRAESTVAIIRRVCEDTPRPLSEINPDIPAWLIDIINRLIAKAPDERFQSASEVADLLEQCLAHVQDPAGNALRDIPSTTRALVVKRNSTPLVRRYWAIGTAALLLLAATLALAESTGVTNVAATIIRIARGDGTLVVQVDDPNVQVLIDGEELVINGAGPKEIRLRPGQHELQSVKDGKPVDSKLITITRDGREVVKVAHEPPNASASSGPLMRPVWTNASDVGGGPSPDGRLLTFTDWSTGDLSIRDLTTGVSRKLTNKGNGWSSGEYAIYSVFSPDGKTIAHDWFNDQSQINELRTIAADGSNSRLLCRTTDSDSHLWPHEWSRDGRFILVQQSKRRGNRQIGLVDVADGSLRVLKDLGMYRGSAEEVKMSLSPDGKWVAFAMRPKEGEPNRDIWLASTDGAAEYTIADHPADDYLLGFSPDGGSIVFASNRRGTTDAWLARVADGKPTGPPALIKADIGDVYPLGMTRDGGLVYSVDVSDKNIYLASLDPQTGKVLSAPVLATQRYEGSNSTPDWSPDGKFLAYISNRQDMPFLCLRSMEDGTERDYSLNQKAQSFGASFNVRWSPDGRSILVGGYRNSQGNLVGYLVDAKTGEMKETRGSLSVWLPDGKSLVYRSGDRKAILRKALDKSSKEQWSSEQGTVVFRSEEHFIQSWAISPDGQQLGYIHSAADKCLHLTVIPMAGGTATELVRGAPSEGLGAVTWSPDGSKVIFVKRPKWDDGRSELWQVSAIGGEPEKLGLEFRTLTELRVHPDGNRIAFASGDKRRDIWAMANFLPPLADSEPPAAANASGGKSE